jgi:hypothetical protein
VVGLAKPDPPPTEPAGAEPAGVWADEETAAVAASKKAIESFAMFKVGLPDLSFSNIVALRQS